ncbi:hypothetical protein SK128_005932, partial [Halocaridina rubra]
MSPRSFNHIIKTGVLGARIIQPPEFTPSRLVFFSRHLLPSFLGRPSDLRPSFFNATNLFFSLTTEKDLTDGGNTVFIDASALGELSSQLTPQELESLVGFNIQAADFEALEDVPESHVVDPSGVLLSDGVTVGNIVEVAGGSSGVDDVQQLDAHSHEQPMEVDTLSDQAQVIGDMEMLQQGGDLIAMGGEELTTTSGTSTATLLATASTVSPDTSTHHIETPQILKSNLGQFVVLQQNQNSISLGSLSNRIITSSGNITTMAGIGNSSSKPVV